MAYGTNETENRIRANVHEAADKTSDLATKASQQLDKAYTTAESAVRGVADQSREAGERVQQVAGNLRTAVDKSVQDQPMATLAIALGMGFVLGALWKS